ncbi:hypothetical protein [Microbulbifer taiwanensis]|uniref:MerR family transcriptional regulator n=1 Tax=Microbulbifer taiwanensis TaxID=986746 RepID=A0ABW1YFZ2_9GAMM
MYKKPTIKDVQALMTFLEVSERTARRYLSNPACMPAPERKLWDYHCNGRIVPDGWPGIRFHGDRLVTDTDYVLHYGQVQQFAWHINCLELLLKDLRQLSARVRELEQSRGAPPRRDLEKLQKLEQVQEELREGLPGISQPAPVRHRSQGC